MWGITHETSSLHYPQSNRFADACIKSIIHVLQWTKYSSADPQLALLALQATPIDTKLPSPAELLYQCWLRITILAKIHNNDPSAIQVHEQIDTHSETAKSQANKCSKTPVPLYAGQPVAMYDTLRRIWIPATVIHVLPQNSYQVHTSNGFTYHCMWRHFHECSVKAVDTVPSDTTAKPQALTRHCFSVAQPALPPPAQCMQPHTLHLQHWQPRWTRPQLFLPHQLFKGTPWHQCLWHSMPHLCSHEDRAMPTWYPDAWSRKSKNYQPKLSIDLVLVTCHHLHPHSFIELNCSVSYSQKAGCHMIVFCFKDWSLNQLTSVLQYIYILVSQFYHTWHLDLKVLRCVYMFQ